MRVAYVWSEQLQALSDDLPANLGRSSLVHGLIRALGLLEKAFVVEPDLSLGTPEVLQRYHDAEYVGE